MLGPPKDVTPEQLWKKLKETPQPSEVVDFPRKDDHGRPICRIRMRVLNMNQETVCKERALKKLLEREHTSEELRDGPGKELLGDASAKEILALACQGEQNQEKNPEKPSKYALFFPDAEAVGELTGDEVTVLWMAYQLTQHRYGPRQDTEWNPQSVTAWIQRLVEGGKHDPLLLMSWPQLVELTASLALRAYILSATLDSLFANLPDTLKSHPEISAWGIGSSGWRPVKFTGQRLSIESNSNDDELEVPRLPLTNADGEDITLEQAMHVSDILRGQA